MIEAMQYIFQKGTYEILSEIKKHGKIQPSKLAELITTISEKTLYKRLDELKRVGLIVEAGGLNESGRPVKYYSLTQLGLKVLSKFKEVEQILQEEKALNK